MRVVLSFFLFISSTVTLGIEVIPEVEPVEVTLLDSDVCEILEDSNLYDICGYYKSEPESYLTTELVESCKQSFENKEKHFDICLRVSSRVPNMTSSRISACSRVSVVGIIKDHCLRLAPLIKKA